MGKNDERVALPCPHGRLPIDGVDGWKHCPHCLGINQLKVATPKPNTTKDEIGEAVEKTVDYLYKIEGDCPPELYQAIATLRQLINEEFNPEKSISSQFIYDIINPAITKLVARMLQGRN